MGTERTDTLGFGPMLGSKGRENLQTVGLILLLSVSFVAPGESVTPPKPWCII